MIKKQNITDTWNYRVILRKNYPHLYQIHEVFYNKKGEPVFWTEEPCFPIGETVQGLKVEWKSMEEAFKQPILEEKDNKLIELKNK